MAEELLVVLSRRDPCGFGFSLLGTPGLPPIIYDIVENSPAAESGKVRFLNYLILLGTFIPQPKFFMKVTQLE